MKSTTPILNLLSRTRGATIESAKFYPDFDGSSSVDATRKMFERERDKGQIASFSLPNGQRLFHLSHTGVRATSAPAAWANSPTENIAAEMLSVCYCGWRPEYKFLTPVELSTMLKQSSSDFEPPKIPGRFLLTPASSGSEHLQLHYWLVELRPPDHLAKRIATITQRLSRSRCFEELINLRQFGITVAVPTDAVKHSLGARSFEITVKIETVPALAELIYEK